jgi:Rps23 Pro-64 3,4-dihydroxylase Tpa1-like proline 4-hydroxylase
MDLAAEVVGRPVRDGQEATLGPWIYPQDSGLSLHQDTGRAPVGQYFTGSYTYYVNRTWNLHWGGWLMLLDPAEATPTATVGGFGVSPPWLADDLERAWVDGPGIATAVLPAPNRIVFISPAVRHLITRVDRNAGQHARVSLAGFFVHKG